VSSSPGAPLRLSQLPELLERVHATLEEHREVIDELNVFPIPDGDTGTNMTLTVRSALEAVDGAADPHERTAAAIRGAIRGARGNSGVILSQVLRAVAEVAGEVEADGGTNHLDAMAMRRRSSVRASSPTRPWPSRSRARS
jgi:dihydroxyacetone kinase-like predicted kinase